MEEEEFVRLGRHQRRDSTVLFFPAETWVMAFGGPCLHSYLLIMLLAACLSRGCNNQQVCSRLPPKDEATKVHEETSIQGREM